MKAKKASERVIVEFLGKLKKEKRNRKKREITNCPHKSMQHYAKGMCSHCYHLYGRQGKADKCEHTDRYNYAKGLY